MPNKDADNFPNYWHVGLCTTCCQVPLQWCLGCICGPCYSCNQRISILEGNMDDYRCCGRVYLPCTCGEENCPYLCLCIEVFLCFWCSVFANRSMIQQKYQIRNTAFESAMIWLVCIVSWIYCLLRTFTSFNLGEAEWLCDVMYCMFAGCMQSQQHAELKYQRSGPKNMKMSDF